LLGKFNVKQGFIIYILFFLYFFLCISRFLFAHSLQVKIQNDFQDTIKISEYIKCCKDFIKEDVERAIKCGKEANNIANKYNLFKEKTEARMCLAAAYNHNKQPDDALLIYSQIIRDIESKQKEADKTRKDYIYSCLAECYTNKGDIYSEKELHKQALSAYHKALIFFRKKGDKKGIANCYNSIGVKYSDQGTYDIALNYYLKALLIKEELGDMKMLSVCYTNIGVVYFYQEDFENAIEYYNKALKIDQKAGDREGESTCLNNIGSSYFSLNKFEKALEYYNKALKIDLLLNNTLILARDLNNIGLVYANQKKYSGAMESYQKSFSIYNQLENDYGKAAILANIADLYYKLDNFSMAVSKANESLEYIQNTQAYFVKQSVYNTLSEANEKLGNFNYALSYYKKYSEIKNNILTGEQRNKISKQMTQYEVDKKEKENTILKQQNQIQLLSLKNQRIVTYILIIVLLFVIVTAVFIFYLYRINKKTNQFLEAHKQRLQNTNSKLLATKRDLTDTIAVRDKFLSILSHDLKNPLISVISFTQLIKNSIGNISEKELKGLAENLSLSINQMYQMLENLLLWTMSQQKLLLVNKENINAHKIIEKNILFHKISIDSKNITVSNHVDKNLIISFDKNMIDAIFRNLISNAIKFAPQNGEIKIFSHISDKTIFEINDNGIGIKEEDMPKLFSEETVLIKNGTMHQKGHGLGLSLCQEFIKKNGGEIWIESIYEKGTSVKFSIQ